MKPNCCVPLKLAVKSVAILDFITAALSVLTTSGALLYLHLFPVEVDDFFTSQIGNSNSSYYSEGYENFVNLSKLWSSDHALITTLLVLGILYSLQKLILACVLIIAVFQERLKPLRIWIAYTLIVLVLFVIFFLGFVFLGVLEPWSIPFFVGAFLSREYVLWLGHCFLQKIQAEQVNDSSYLIESNRVVYKL